MTRILNRDLLRNADSADGRLHHLPGPTSVSVSLGCSRGPEKQMGRSCPSYGPGLGSQGRYSLLVSNDRSQ